MDVDESKAIFKGSLEGKPNGMLNRIKVFIKVWQVISLNQVLHDRCAITDDLLGRMRERGTCVFYLQIFGSRRLLPRKLGFKRGVETFPS